MCKNEHFAHCMSISTVKSVVENTGDYRLIRYQHTTPSTLALIHKFSVRNVYISLLLISFRPYANFVSTSEFNFFKCFLFLLKRLHSGIYWWKEREWEKLIILCNTFQVGGNFKSFDSIIHGILFILIYFAFSICV